MAEQEKFWKGAFGDEYTARNNEHLDVLYLEQYDITRSELNKAFLSQVNTGLNILEVGCNRGLQLKLLYSQGYHNLWGIDVNNIALTIGRESKNYVLTEGSIFDIPFLNDSFGLVFTSGLLIHIHPDRLKDAIKELYRVSRKYIWCFEYYSKVCERTDYRGHKNQLWKNDFRRLFQEYHPDLRLVKKRIIESVHHDSLTMMFLLEREA